MRKFLLSIAVAAGLVGFTVAPAAAKSGPSSCVKALDASTELRTEATILFTDTGMFLQKLRDNAALNAATSLVTFFHTLTTDTQDLGAAFAAEHSKIDDITGRIDRYGARCRAGR